MTPAADHQGVASRSQSWRRMTIQLPIMLAVALLGSTAIVEAKNARHRQGHYEAGRALWSSRQAVPGGIALTPRPRRGGRHAARFVVRPGDDPIGARGERAEMVSDALGGRRRQESWYGWSTLFPRNLNPVIGHGKTNIFTQWHQVGPPPEGAHVPPIRFSIDTGDDDPKPYHMFLRVAGGQPGRYSFQKFDLGRMPVGHWVDFAFHVKWSPNPRRGYVELWINGDKVVRRTVMATIYRGRRNYLKQGWYRADSKATSVIYHMGMRRGKSRRAVSLRR